VRLGNLLNKHVSLLCTICSICGVHWGVEQPASTLFYDTLEMKRAIEFSQATRVWIPLGEFGHKMQKPTVLYATFLAPKPGYQQFKKNIISNRTQKKPAAYTVSTRADGTKAVMGGAALMESQIYPTRLALWILTLIYPAVFEV